MTPKKKTIMLFIKTWYKENGFMPSQLEIAEEMGVSVPTINQHLSELEIMGLITKDKFQKRAINLLPLTLR